MVPALTDVRTRSLFADGVEVQLSHQLLEAQIFWASRCAHTEPWRFVPAGQRLGAGLATANERDRYGGRHGPGGDVIV